MNIEIKAAMLTIRDKARGDVPQGFPTYLSDWEKRGKVQSQAVFNTSGRVRKFPLLTRLKLRPALFIVKAKAFKIVRAIALSIMCATTQQPEQSMRLRAVFNPVNKVDPTTQGPVNYSLEPWAAYTVKTKSAAV